MNNCGTVLSIGQLCAAHNINKNSTANSIWYGYFWRHCISTDNDERWWWQRLKLRRQIAPLVMANIAYQMSNNWCVNNPKETNTNNIFFEWTLVFELSSPPINDLGIKMKLLIMFHIYSPLMVHFHQHSRL